jgi:hypothetical protein
MEQTVSTQVWNCSSSSISPCTSHRSIHIVSDKTKEIPNIGDIWIFHYVRSPNHFTRFFILEIEILFQAGDRILRVEASGISSRLVCWKLWQDVEF